ncbi:MAG: pseudouridine synthase, partial [Flavobacteriales bacterium CG_4_9_14_0_2_um_filter_35_242]
IAADFVLDDKTVHVDEISYVANESKSEIGIEIHSGRNRIVRRIFEHFGYTVVKLDRVMIANLTKKNLPRGNYRMLTDQEVINLKML